MSWTDERVELLKKLWQDGLSASQIASELGGVTRNAVIGKVHRLGLSGRGKAQVASATRVRKPRVAAGPSKPRASRAGAAAAVKLEPELETKSIPLPQIEPDESIVVPIAKRATILTLTETTCKWPIGDPGDPDFHFCGNPATGSAPYCKYHCSIAYQPVRDRKKAKSA